jgi:hypothetical protein
MDNIWKGDTPESDIQKKFRKSMEKNNRDIVFYYGKWFYKGWAIRIDTIAELQDVIRATRVKLQYDQLGLGYIVYPQGV